MYSRRNRRSRRYWRARPSATAATTPTLMCPPSAAAAATAPATGKPTRQRGAPERPGRDARDAHVPLVGRRRGHGAGDGEPDAEEVRHAPPPSWIDADARPSPLALG